MSWKECGNCGFRDKVGNAKVKCPNCGQSGLYKTVSRNPQAGKSMTREEFKGICGDWVRKYREGREDWELQEDKDKILDNASLFGLDADLVLYNLKVFADTGQEVEL